MSLVYHVYGNDGAGGAIDLTTILDTVSGLTWDTPALGTPSDNAFLVRAYDTVTTLEDLNLDASCRIVISASGTDITNVPNAPYGLYATPLKAGAIRVHFAYSAIGQVAAPSGFKIWIQAGGSINYALTPSGTLSYAGTASYAIDVAGFTGGTSYTVAVRATNATGDETNTTTVTVTADTAGPLPVANLDFAATFGPPLG
jgi:hypothetical protein